MQKEMNPCPVCKGNNLEFKILKSEDYPTYFILMCATCRPLPVMSYMAHGRDKNKVIDQWNTFKNYMEADDE